MFKQYGIQNPDGDVLWDEHWSKEFVELEAKRRTHNTGEVYFPIERELTMSDWCRTDVHWLDPETVQAGPMRGGIEA